jgi:hypothetical protein
MTTCTGFLTFSAVDTFIQINDEHLGPLDDAITYQGTQSCTCLSVGEWIEDGSLRYRSCVDVLLEL